MVYLHYGNNDEEVWSIGKCFFYKKFFDFMSFGIYKRSLTSWLRLSKNWGIEKQLSWGHKNWSPSGNIWIRKSDEDHRGLEFELSMFKISFRFDIYDRRHVGYY